MKIIKRGQIPEEKVYNKTCGRCHSELEFQQKELTHVDSDDQRDSNLGTISCPVCGDLIYASF